MAEDRLQVNQAELLGTATAEARFQLGLLEVITQWCPVEAGLVERDWRASIESTWCFTSERLELDPLSPTEHPNAVKLASAARVYDLIRTTEGGLPALLRDSERSRAFADHRTFSFVPEWEVALADRPSTPSGPALETPQGIGFTFDVRGNLENCQCSATENGGLARMAFDVGSQRQRDPNLLLFSLGNCTPLEPQIGGASLEREQQVYAQGMAFMGYDAVSVGPDELYAGLPSPMRSEIFLGRVRRGPERPLKAWAKFERSGRTLAFVALADWLSLGSLRDEFEGVAAGFTLAPLDSELRQELRRLRAEVDVVIVGGQLTPATVRALADEGLADVILVGERGRNHYADGVDSGFLGDTLVAHASRGPSGVHHLKLLFAPGNRIADYEFSARTLTEQHRSDPTVQSLIQELK